MTIYDHLRDCVTPIKNDITGKEDNLVALPFIYFIQSMAYVLYLNASAMSGAEQDPNVEIFMAGYDPTMTTQLISFMSYLTKKKATMKIDGDKSDWYRPEEMINIWNEWGRVLQMTGGSKT